MTIASQTSRISYVGDGSTTAFAVPFFFSANTDLVVMLQNSSGVQTLQVLGTQYSLSGAGVSSGGTCTFTVAPTSTTGAVITIYRDPPVTQTTSYNNNDPFPAKSHENALDKLTTLEQRTRDLITRSIRLPDSDPVLSPQLPTLALRANKLLGFDTNGLPTAVLGPSFVGGTDIGAAVISTKAVAQVTTFASSVLYLIIGGTTVSGDTIQQTYIRGSGTGSFTDGGSVSWKPVPTPAGLSVSIGLSALGDGTTNDQAAMQATLNTVAAAGGGTVYLTSGKTYRAVINTGVTDHGLIIPTGVTLLLNNATINLECTGNVFGVRLQSNAAIIGPGTIATTVSASLGSGQAIYHTPISLGSAYGDYPTVASLNAYASPTGWKIRNLTVTNVRADTPTPGGEMICIFGGANHGLIEDITIPDNATVGIGIGMDWMPVGPVDLSTLTTINATKTAFLAGTAYTLHPHDIDVSRINIGNMSAPKTVGNDFGSHGIRLSGCYAIRIDGVTVAGSTYAGFFHTAGDAGFEFAPSSVKNFRYKGTRVSNYRIENANNGWGVFSDCLADNVLNRVTDGYVNMLPTTGETDIVYDNVQTQGSLTSSAWPGFRIQYQSGGELRNCRARYHAVGALVETNCDRIRIVGGIYDSNWTHGISASSSNPVTDLLVQGIQSVSNGQGGGTLDAGIYLNAAFRPVVRDCVLGGPGESFQNYGVLATTGAQDVFFEDNFILAHVAGGAAISMGSSSDVGVGAIMAKVSGNRFGAGVTTKYGGGTIVPHDYRFDLSNQKILECSAATGALTSGITPPTGTWTRGSRIFYTDPSASGKVGVVCVNPGSPGTWKAFGAIDA